MPELAEIQRFVDALLLVDRFAGHDDPAGLYPPTSRPIRRLGLTVDADEGIEAWLAGGAFDALVVHRPWNLPLAAFPDLVVLAYHLSFDERLTLGLNPWLADALGVGNVEPFGTKHGRLIGMIGEIPYQPLDQFVALLRREFGPLEGLCRGERVDVTRVAVVGAV